MSNAKIDDVELRLRAMEIALKLFPDGKMTGATPKDNADGLVIAARILWAYLTEGKRQPR